MSLINDFVDTMHKIAVKFTPAFLPDAKKPYNLKPVHQQTLDVHGVAGKADAYNIGIDPKIIETGLNGGLKLMRYLACDGFRIKTPLFNLRIRVPGEYEGSETSLPDGVRPVVRLGSSADFREYVRERVQIEFDGVDNPNGMITGFLDIDEDAYKSIFVPGNMFSLTGSKIRVEGSDPACGVFFADADNPSNEVKVTRIGVNTRSKIVGICPNTGHARSRIVIKTQFAGNSTNLKNIRTIISSFVVEEV